MFRFAKDGQVRWPLTVDQLQEDGSTASQAFVVTYERLTRDELKTREAAQRDYLQKFRALLPDDGSLDTPERMGERDALAEAYNAADDARLRSKVKGWSGIADQHGAPLGFSGDLLEAFIGDPLLRKTLLQGLVDASTGAHAKNSLPGLAGLPVPAQA